MTDPLQKYSHLIEFEKIQLRRKEQREALLDIPFWDKYRSVRESLPKLCGRAKTRVCGGAVTVGTKADLTENESSKIEHAARALIPWRKGPFNLFGFEIDAEWRSDKKWERISPHTGSLKNHTVLDIGCNNGYYLFRISESEPALIVGCDPSARCFYQFDLIQRYAQAPNISFELLGVEDTPLFPDFFDTVFCMGVIYHNRNPLKMLSDLHSCLKKNGRLILETMAIPGDEPVSLSPPERYAKLRNVWFVPTAACLKSWMIKAGFKDAEIVSSVRLDPLEQRSTELAPWESLKDFLDPRDNTKTVEGYPAPFRIAAVGKKIP